MKLMLKLCEKRGSVTMMGVGMLPVFVLIAGLITLILFFWTSYARLITAADAGALTATKYLEDGANPLLDHTPYTLEEVSTVTFSYEHDSLTEQVQQAVVNNGGGSHGEIICTKNEIQVIASMKVLGRWTIYAKGRGAHLDGLSARCNWRKISY
jgi:hypothetical protein